MGGGGENGVLIECMEEDRGEDASPRSLLDSLAVALPKGCKFLGPLQSRDLLIPGHSLMS